MELGVDRLLTSGQAARALDGAKMIQALVQRAGKELVVMAGAGIRTQDVATLVRATGVREIHASASEVIVEERAHAARIVRETRVTRQEQSARWSTHFERANRHKYKRSRIRRTGSSRS